MTGGAAAPLTWQAAGGPSQADSPLDRAWQQVRHDGSLRLARQQGLGDTTWQAIDRALRAESWRDAAAAETELRRALAWALQACSPQPGDGALQAVAQLTRAGDFDGGADAVDRALARLDAEQATRAPALREDRRRLLQAGLQQDLLRRDADAAAARLEALVALDEPAGAVLPTESSAWSALEDQHVAEGRDRGLSLPSALAIAMRRRRLRAAPDAAARCAAGLRLAQALHDRGIQTGDNQGLDDALAVCRQVLAHCTEDEAPAAWADAQQQCAESLCALAQRDGRQDRLLQALQAADHALRHRRRDLDPLAWARAQLLRGKVLRSLGELQADGAALWQAVQALRNALLELTPARALSDRAQALNQLAVALNMVGAREGKLDARHEAIAVHRESVLLIDRERSPMPWSQAQLNLGIALSQLGVALRDLDLMQQAVQAYQAAAAVRDRRSVPARWALAQHNLAMALARVGEFKADPAPLAEAVAILREVLTIHTREAHPRAWGASLHELATALQRWGSLTPGPPGARAIREAIALLSETLLARDRTQQPLEWAKAQADLAELNLRLAQHSGERDAATRAAAHLARVREVLHAEAHAEVWQLAQALQHELDAWLRQSEAGPPETEAAAEAAAGTGVRRQDPQGDRVGARTASG